MTISVLRVSSRPTSKLQGVGLAAFHLSSSSFFNTDLYSWFVKNDSIIPLDSEVEPSNLLQFNNPQMPKKRSGLLFYALTIKRFLVLIKFLISIAWRVRGLKYDILHLHNIMFSPLLFLLPGSFKKSFLTIHGTDFLRLKQSALLRFFISKFDYILCVTNEQKLYVKSTFSSLNVHYISNGVDINFFHPVCKNVLSKQIIAIGTLRWHKDYSSLIKAFNLLKFDHPDWKLVIVGDGPEHKHLLQLIKLYNLKESITLTGRLDRIELKRYLMESSIFVSSSVTEGLPKTLLEAMASGCACVATDVGECKNILEGVGLIVPPNNYNQLSKAIAHLMDHPLELEQMSNLSLKSASTCSWEDYVSKHILHYTNALSHYE